MLIIALVLALIGLVSLVFAVVANNELVAWVCIGASVLGVVLLIVDAVRERQQESDAEAADAVDDADGAADADAVDYPEEVADDESSDSDVVDDVTLDSTRESSDVDPTVAAEHSGDESAK
jgi:hypothetical protein